MTDHTPQDVLQRYDELLNRYTAGGGYDTDTETDKICNGLGIPAAQRQQDFDSLSGGEKTRVNLGRLILEDTDIAPPSGYERALSCPRRFCRAARRARPTARQN